MEQKQKKFEEDLAKFQKAQSDLEKHIAQRQQLESQLTENKFVKDEFDILKKDDVIYKLVGPVLLKQDLSEAMQNVNKRVEYIQGEIKRHENMIKELQSKQESLKENLNKSRMALQA